MNQLQVQKTVEAIREATQEVFTTMLDLEVGPGQFRLVNGKPAEIHGVLAVLGLAGEMVGTGTLWCGDALACRIASRMLMTECASLDRDVLDAFGEIANMIIGNVKVEMEPETGPMGLSIPTVIYGDCYVARASAPGEHAVVAFTCAAEPFEVSLSLYPKSHS